MIRDFYNQFLNLNIIQEGFVGMEWMNQPGVDLLDSEAGPETEGYGGRFQLMGEDQNELILRPESKKQFW